MSEYMRIIARNIGIEYYLQHPTPVTQIYKYEASMSFAKKPITQI
jgi:hypothetical protein